MAARQFDVDARGKNLRAYSGTSGVEEKPYQKAVVSRAKLGNYGRIILADEVGLGKTIEACLIFSEYRQLRLVESCLILVPSRELAQQWERELTDKFGLLRTKELGRYRAAGWSGFDRHDVSILTYQAAVSNATAVMAQGWDMIICDEAHHLTNRGSERFRLVKVLSQKVPYLLLLTATPIQRRVDDLFSLAQLVRPSMFSTLKEFRERHCDPRNTRTIIDADDLVHRMRDIMVRNRAGAVSSEVLLGRRRFNDLNVTLTENEREFYEGVESLVFKAYKQRESGEPPLAYYSLARAASSSPTAAAKWLETLANEPSVSAEAKRLFDFALQQGKVAEAIALLKLNVEFYPNSWNVYDSLAEAYMTNGEKDLAIANYKKSLELNPQNSNGREMLKKLGQ